MKRWMTLTMAVLPLFLGLSAQAGVRGPYLQKLGTDSIVVAMEGDFTGPPVVHYGVESLDENQQALSCQGVHCHTRLTGLTPDTRYLYQVMGPDGTPWPESHFHTAPDSTVPFTFVVHGDNRSDHASHAMVVSSIAEQDFAFVVNTGDLISSGENEADWEQFFHIEADLLRSTVLYPAMGNHEEHDGDCVICRRMFHTPWQESASSSSTYYSFRYSNAHFLVLDNFIEVDDWYLCLLQGQVAGTCMKGAQRNWIQQDLAKAAGNPDIHHVFVFVHEGPYSSKENRSGSADLRALLPLFAQSKVKVVFSGHDHYFEHGVSGNGVHYVISGGGGAPLYSINPDFLSQIYPHQVLVNQSVHNYQTVTVEGPHVRVTTINPNNGVVLEEFALGTPPDCVVPADCPAPPEGQCFGQWTCIQFHCIWECAPAPVCETPEDCPETPEGACPGEWGCNAEGHCIWNCYPSQECQSDVDCAEKPPLRDCAGGSYGCVSGICEWTCPPPGPDVVQPDPDVVEGTPDADPPEATEGADVLPPEDSSGEKGDGLEQLFPDTGAASGVIPAPRRGGGCHHGGPHYEGAAILILLLVFALIVYRRKRIRLVDSGGKTGRRT
jgi:hypothetical protein